MRASATEKPKKSKKRKAVDTCQWGPMGFGCVCTNLAYCEVTYGGDIKERLCKHHADVIKEWVSGTQLKRIIDK